MIRLQPRRIPNVIAGLTVFWCCILSIFLWVKGFNFPFLFILFLVVAGGFLIASHETVSIRNSILRRLGFKFGSGVTADDPKAFQTVENGVFSSLGPVPFQYTLPARLNAPGAQLAQRVQEHLPAELVLAPDFTGQFIAAIDSSPHSRLIRAILEVYCHPDHIRLPAGIARHNGALLLTHSLRVAALMLHRAESFASKNFWLLPIDPNYKLSKNDGLLVVIGLCHDLGKVNSFLFDSNKSIVGMHHKHHHSSSRIVSALPEFWGIDLNQDDRYIVQSCCIYSTEFDNSPVQRFNTFAPTLRVVSDRFQLMVELLKECDILASKIENNVKYSFSTLTQPVNVNQIDTQSNNQSTATPINTEPETCKPVLDLFDRFSEFIATCAVVNGAPGSGSAAFKHTDQTSTPPRHLLYFDESEFTLQFSKFLNRNDWEPSSKNSLISGLTMAVLPVLDAAGYLVRSSDADVGVRPAVNCLYKVNFVTGDPATIAFVLKSTFVLDITDWPRQDKLRNLESCHARPVMAHCVFGNRFGRTNQTTLTDSTVMAELNAQVCNKSDLGDITKLTKKITKTTKSAKNPSQSKAAIDPVICVAKIKMELTKKALTPAIQPEPGKAFPIINADAFFESLGIKMIPCDEPGSELKDIGIVAIRESKKNPGSHVVMLDQSVYPV